MHELKYTAIEIFVCRNGYKVRSAHHNPGDATVYSEQIYVFADLPSLSSWLGQNLKEPVEPIERNTT